MINLNKRKWIPAIAFAAFAAGIFYLGGISLAQSTEKEVVDVAPTDSTQFLAGNGKNSPVVDPLVKKNGIDEPENYVSTNEVEPNETAAAATKLGGSAIRVRGDIYPNADVDFILSTPMPAIAFLRRPKHLPVRAERIRRST
ncbi:MAG: hypothetical protein IPK58_00650 [Acidobacteria bacterium]|nr:hypothetical protein [Acidobacteriota bacterium]